VLVLVLETVFNKIQKIAFFEDEHDDEDESNKTDFQNSKLATRNP
jgi:hypothetical protein